MTVIGGIHVTVVSDAEDDLLSIPGPTIAVFHGDEVSVNVVNDLERLTTTMRWHGTPSTLMEGQGSHSARYSLVSISPGTTSLLRPLVHTGTMDTLSCRGMMDCMVL